MTPPMPGSEERPVFTLLQRVQLEVMALKRLASFLMLWLQWRRDFIAEVRRDWLGRLPLTDDPSLYDLGCNACGAKWTGFFPMGTRGGKAQCPDCRAMEGVIVRKFEGGRDVQ